MARNTNSKCALCGKMWPTEDMITVSNKRYCPHCGEGKKKEAVTNMKINDLLFEWCNGEGAYMPRFNAEINRLLKNYSKYGWKAKGILATLEYMFSSETPPVFTPEVSLTALLEKYYPLAKDYFLSVKDLKDKFPEEYMKEILSRPVKEIHIKRSELNKQEQSTFETRKNLLYGPPINLEEIE